MTIRLPPSIDVKIQGQVWSVRFLPRHKMPKKTWGDCDRVSRVIRVRRDLAAKNVLDTLIHEVRHAQHPVMFEAEEFIDQTSTEIATVISLAGMLRVK